jgi:hypothetical protein
MTEVYKGMGGNPNTFNHPVIALVIDNEIVSVLNTDERLGAILLSTPQIIDISEAQYNNPAICEGWGYKDGKFISPMEEE